MYQNNRSRVRAKRLGGVFTHFQVFVHQSVSVHGLQIPVLVPLGQLGVVLYILPSAPSLLHLPARPPVLQQAGKVEVESLAGGEVINPRLHHQEEAVTHMSTAPN